MYSAQHSPDADNISDKRTEKRCDAELDNAKPLAIESPMQTSLYLASVNTACVDSGVGTADGGTDGSGVKSDAVQLQNERIKAAQSI